MCNYTSAMHAINQILGHLKFEFYISGEKFISGYNIFPATVYFIGYVIDTGLVQGVSQTWSKPRETQRIY